MKPLMLLIALAPAIACAAELPASKPPLYAFCYEFSDANQRPFPEQVRMVRELGFDAIGCPLWLDASLAQNLRVLDEAQLPVHALWTSVDLTKALDPRIPAAILQLKGRPATVCVLLTGFPPGDPRGMDPAVRLLRQLGDAAAEAGVRISIYNHVDNWTESIPFILQVVAKADHRAVGYSFNLCHWLKVSGKEDYRPLLRAHRDKLFAVTLNGATVGATAWTNGLIRPLDEGDFDNRQLLTALREIGYRGPVGLMCYGIPGDAREHLARSMKVWRQWHAPAGQ